MPLRDKKILLTRDPGGPLATELTSLGALVTAVPTIVLVDPPSWHKFDQAALAQASFSWLLFTSKEAVSRTAQRLEFLQTPCHPHLKIAAVGSQTAKLAEQYFGRVDLIPADYQAEGLMQAWAELDLANIGIWFPRALEAREDFTEFLAEKGAKLNLCPVYQNILPPESKGLLQQALAQGQDWVTFTSASTVNNFFQLLGSQPPRLPKAAAIGKVTALELQKYHWPVSALARPQTLQGLVQAMLEAENA